LFWSDRTDFYGGGYPHSEYQLIILRVLLHRKSLSFDNFVKLPVYPKSTISNLQSATLKGNFQKPLHGCRGMVAPNYGDRHHAGRFWQRFVNNPPALEILHRCGDDRHISAATKLIIVCI
jgi:hypothetical protein